MRLKFLLKVTLVSTGAYLIAGALAYQLLTKQYYVGEDPIFARYLRSEAEPALWRHVMTWQFPMLFLRGASMALTLLPFRSALDGFALSKRMGALFGLSFVWLHLAAAAPSPSNLEGIIYMRPELIGVVPFLLTQPEMLLQAALFAAGTSWWACHRPSEILRA